MIFLSVVVSCNDYKVFNEEMYKKVFALVSTGDYNILTVEHDLDSLEVTGYVSASCGGTTPNEKDLHIKLREDRALFDRYNVANFENSADFAQLLNPQKYSIADLNFTIPKGEKIGRMPVKVRPEGLSPDSTYFISFKVDNFSDYEANPKKTDVLYKITLKNFWALQATPTNYQLKGVYEGNSIIGNKRMFPLTHNSVRVNIGNITNFSADTASINNGSIILQLVDKKQGEKVVLGKKYNVVVKPYKWVTIINPSTIDPDYPNVFFIEDDGYRTYKTFLLHYNYRLPNSSTVYEMKEELRMEFVYQDY
jgi:hypothetical protein